MHNEIGAEIRRANTRAFQRQVSRARMDLHEIGGGTVRATLTVTLPGGHEMRFTGEGRREDAFSADVGAESSVPYRAELDPIAGKRVGISSFPTVVLPAMVTYFKRLGFSKAKKPPPDALQDYANRHKTAGSADGVVKVLKAVAKPALAVASAAIPGVSLVRDVASTAAKVAASLGAMRTAENALKSTASQLGPVAPAALAASRAMKASRAILAAREHANRGNPAKARALVDYAASVAKHDATLHASQSTANKVFAVMLKPV